MLGSFFIGLASHLGYYHGKGGRLEPEKGNAPTVTGASRLARTPFTR